MTGFNHKTSGIKKPKTKRIIDDISLGSVDSSDSWSCSDFCLCSHIQISLIKLSYNSIIIEQLFNCQVYGWGFFTIHYEIKEIMRVIF